MDPFSFVAGIAGIVCAGAQLSRSLYEISNRLINAPKEIADIASDLSQIGTIFEHLRQSLESHRDLIKDELLQTLKETLARFEALQEDVKHFITSAKRFERLKWLFRRERVADLMVKVSAVRGNLNMLVSIVQVAVTISIGNKKSKTKKTKRHRERERCHRILAETCAEALRHVIRDLRVQQTCQQRMQSSQQELLVFRHWKEPLSQTAAWLYYSTLASSVETTSHSSVKYKVGVAKTVATHDHGAEDVGVSDNESTNGNGDKYKHAFSCRVEDGDAIPEDAEYELHVTRNLGHKVVDRLLHSWTTTNKLDIIENGKVAQTKQDGTYQQALEGVIKALLKDGQNTEAVVDGHKDVADNAVTSTPNGGLLNPRSTHALPPAPKAPAPAVPPAYTEDQPPTSASANGQPAPPIPATSQPDTESNAVQEPHPTVDTNAGAPTPSNLPPQSAPAPIPTTPSGEGSVPSRDDPDALPEDPPLSALEGLCCEKDGSIKDHSGKVIGRVTEGDAAEFAAKLYFCDALGNICDYKNKAVGKCAVLRDAECLEQPKERTQHDDRHGFVQALGLSGSKQKTSPKPTQDTEDKEAKNMFGFGGWGSSWSFSEAPKREKGVSSDSKVDGEKRDDNDTWGGWGMPSKSHKKSMKTTWSEVIAEHNRVGGGHASSERPDALMVQSKEDSNLGNERDGNIKTTSVVPIDKSPDDSDKAGDQDAMGPKMPLQRQNSTAPMPTPSIEDVLDKDEPGNSRTGQPPTYNLPQGQSDNELARVIESTESDSEALKPSKSVSFTDSKDWRDHPTVLAPWQPTSSASRENNDNNRGRSQERHHVGDMTERMRAQIRAAQAAEAASKSAGSRAGSGYGSQLPSARKVPSSSVRDSSLSNHHMPSSRATSQRRRMSYMGSESMNDVYAWDPHYAMMQYQPSGQYPPPSSYYGYPGSSPYASMPPSGQPTPAPPDPRMIELEQRLKAQEKRIQDEEQARSKAQEAAQRQKLEEDRRAAEQKRERELEQMKQFFKEQQERSDLLEKTADARVSAADEAVKAATSRAEELERQMQDALDVQERTAQNTGDQIAKLIDQAAKAEQETERQKQSAQLAAAAAESDRQALLSEMNEKIRVETDAKRAAETARISAEERVRDLERSQHQRLAVQEDAMAGYPWHRAAQPYEPPFEATASEEDESDSDTETTVSGPRAWSANGSLRRRRANQRDLEDDSSHKIIFPLRSGWKEHETKSITKTMSRFGYQPLFEENEVACVPSQFYEMPGAGGCNLRGTALWQPPGPNLASELYTSFLRSGWKPSYVRTNELGETWFLGRQPIHVIMCTIDYIPQASTDSAARDDHRYMGEGKLYISKEWVETDTLDELGYKHRVLSDWRVSLDPALTHADIETAVARSFLLRESRLRKKYRNFAAVSPSPAPRIHEVSSEFGDSKEFGASTSSVNKVSRWRSFIARSNSRSTGSS